MSFKDQWDNAVGNLPKKEHNNSQLMITHFDDMFDDNLEQEVDLMDERIQELEESCEAIETAMNDWWEEWYIFCENNNVAHLFEHTSEDKDDE